MDRLSLIVKMKPIKVMVTGIAIGTEVSDICNVCNYDYEWLLTKPSTLIWADKIIVTPFIYDTIKKEKNPKSNANKKINQAISKIFEIAENFDIIEIKSPKDVINKDVGEDISKEVKNDRDLLIKLFPKTIKGPKKDYDGPGMIFVENYEYCYPHLWSIYASLNLAREWNAESLFSDSVYDYCKYKFGLSLIKDRKSSVTSFDSVFNLISPEQGIIPLYAYQDIVDPNRKCEKCAHMQKCEESFLDDLENNVHKYLELRDHDEIQQIKLVLKDVINRLEKSSNEVSNEDIKEEFNSQKIKINRDLKKTFPKIKRWSNLFLIASTPAALLGLATGLPMVSYAGATIAGASFVADKAIEYQENKYRWVVFMDRRIKDKIQPQINR